MNKYQKLIKDICDENNINFSLISKNWIMVLNKGEKTRYITGYKFDLNTHALGEILDDKFGFFELLKLKNIPVVEHAIIYSSKNNNEYAVGCNNYNYVYDYYEKNNNHIVIKINKGTCGEDVYNITNKNDIKIVLDNLFVKNQSLSICPYYDIKKEYRVIVLNNKVELIYCKERPLVVGDGIKTIKELLIEFNPNYFNGIDLSGYNRVLKNNESFLYSWKFNLSQGAKFKFVEDKKKLGQLESLALSTAQTINLRFGSIDIIETKDNKLLVLEANSGVMMKNFMEYDNNCYLKTKEIYEKAILDMFK